MPTPTGEKTTTSAGLIAFTPNDELVRREQEAAAKKIADEEQAEPVIQALSGHINTVWQDHRDAKQEEIEERLLKCLRLRKGEYDSETYAMITENGGSDAFFQNTNVKCRAFQSWAVDILAGRPWAITSTPIPDLAGQVEAEINQEVATLYQEAIEAHAMTGKQFDEAAFRKLAQDYKKDVQQALKKRADKDADELELEIDDDLREGGWYKALKSVLWDISTFPAGILKGPVSRMQKTLKWAETGEPIVEDEVQRQWERVNPFDIYPNRNAKNIQDGDLIERHRLTRKALSALIGIDGYSEGAIRKVLAEYETGGLKLWLVNEEERQLLEDKPSGRNELIDALQFWGSVPGSMLLEWGMNKEQIENETDEYDIEAWLIGGTVISAVINGDPLGRRPYYSASFDENPDSIWGNGIPELMEDNQGVCNSTGRAIQNNVGMASGPMVAIITDLMQPGIDIQGLRPWQIFQFLSSQLTPSGSLPIKFFQPQVVVDPLLKIYDYFFKQASEVTGIPAYIYGSADIGGAARTSSGLAMLMNAASKGLKAVIGHIDTGIIEPSIKAHWTNIMLYEPEKAKGDIKIVARASEYLIMMEQLQIRRTEFLNATANEYDMQIMGLEGRAEVLKETAQGLKMNTDRIIPDRESVIETAKKAELQNIINNISRETGIPPDQLMAIASGESGGGTGGAGGGQQQPKARETTPDGSAAGGVESRTA